PQEAEDTGGAPHYPRSMRHRLRPAIAAAGLAVLLLTGCDGSDGSGGAPSEEPSTVQPTSAPTSQTPTPTEEPGEPATNVRSAVENLAERLDIPADDIQAGPLEPVTWSDGSLGCPRPGQSHPQALTDGYRVILTAGGQEYAYHAGAGAVSHAAPPQEPASTADASYPHDQRVGKPPADPPPPGHPPPLRPGHPTSPPGHTPTALEHPKMVSAGRRHPPLLDVRRA